MSMVLQLYLKLLEVETGKHKLVVNAGKLQLMLIWQDKVFLLLLFLRELTTVHLRTLLAITKLILILLLQVLITQLLLGTTLVTPTYQENQLFTLHKHVLIG